MLTYYYKFDLKKSCRKNCNYIIDSNEPIELEIASNVPITDDFSINLECDSKNVTLTHNDNIIFINNEEISQMHNCELMLKSKHSLI